MFESLGGKKAAKKLRKERKAARDAEAATATASGSASSGSASASAPATPGLANAEPGLGDAADGHSIDAPPVPPPPSFTALGESQRMAVIEIFAKVTLALSLT